MWTSSELSTDFTTNTTLKHSFFHYHYLFAIIFYSVIVTILTTTTLTERLYMPILELLLNPFAGPSFNLIACMVWLTIAGCLVIAVIERSFK